MVRRTVAASPDARAVAGDATDRTGALGPPPTVPVGPIAVADRADGLPHPALPQILEIAVAATL